MISFANKLKTYRQKFPSVQNPLSANIPPAISKQFSKQRFVQQIIRSETTLENCHRNPSGAAISAAIKLQSLHVANVFIGCLFWELMEATWQLIRRELSGKSGHNYSLQNHEQTFYFATRFLFVKMRILTTKKTQKSRSF